MLLNQVGYNMNVAYQQLHQAGGFLFGRDEVAWRAVDPATKEVRNVRLPKALIGDTWLGQNSDPRTTTPLVDRIQFVETLEAAHGREALDRLKEAPVDFVVAIGTCPRWTGASSSAPSEAN